MVERLLDRWSDAGGDDAHDDSAETIALDATAAFDVVRNSRRRECIHRLATVRRNEPMGSASISLHDLATHVAAVELDSDPDEVERGDRQRIYVSIYQAHAPRLEDAGLIEWDQCAGVITPSEDVPVLSDLIGEFETACAGDEE